MRHLPILLLTSLLATACGTVASATRPIAEPVGEVLLSAEQEQQLGDPLAAQVGTQTLSQLVLGQNPGALKQLASQVVSAGYLAAYSRDAEREADSRGLNYRSGAGYAPSAMVGFFEELARMSGAAMSRRAPSP